MAWIKPHVKEVDDLPKMSFDELLDKKQAIDLEIQSRQGSEVEKLKARVHALSVALRISSLEFLGIKSVGVTAKKERKKRQGKQYANPDDPTQTWAGLGKRPPWLTERLEAGAQLEDFQIKPAE